MAESNSGSEKSSEIDSILVEYYRRVDAGLSVDRDEFIDEHPQHAETLRELLSADAHVNRLVESQSRHDSEIEETYLSDSSAPQTAEGSILRYFGDYELQEEIARGGMGVVYKARQVSLNRTVAVKMILAGHLATNADKRRFQIEAEAAANLRHSAIVGVYEVGEHDGQLYFAMEFVDGFSLAELVRDGPLSSKQAADHVREIADAIQYAHEQGVLHRDLKPSNILIDEHTALKVTDFGLAKQISRDDLTTTGQILGSPSYMPPEQASGNKALTGPSSDVYSIGAILYELLSGRPPFAASTPLETIRHVLDRDPVSLRLLVPGLDRDLETICLKCLQKEPHNRYLTANHLSEDLARYSSGRPILARPVGRMKRVWMWCRRKPVAACLVLALVALVATLGIGGPLIAIQQSHNAEEQLRLRRGTENESYYAQINLAHREWQLGNTELARALLTGCPQQLRGWEWDLLNRITHSEVKTVSSPHAFLDFAWNFDGRLFVHCGEDVQDRYEAVIRDGQSFAEKLVLSGHTASILSVAFHPTKNQVVTASYDGTVRIWNADTGQQSASVPVEFPSRAEFSPDGNFVAFGSGAEVVLWDHNDGTRRRVLRGHSPGMKQIIDVAFSADGRYLASGGYSGNLNFGEVVLWDRARGLRSKILGPVIRPVHAVALSTDGSMLAAALGDASIAVWNTSNAAYKMSLVGHKAAVSDITFSQSGRELVSASDDGTLRIWNTTTGRTMQVLRAHSEPVKHVEITPGGQLASGCLDLKVWEYGVNNQFASLIPPGGDVTGLAFNSDGTRLAVRSWRGHVETYGAGRLELLHTVANRGTFPQNVFYTGSNDAIVVAGDNTVGVWDVEQSKHLWMHHPGSVLDIGANAEFVAAITGAINDGTIHVWDANTGSDELTVNGHRVAFSPTGFTMAAATAESVVLHSKESSGWSQLRPLPQSYASHMIWEMTFSKDGTMLAVAAKKSNPTRPHIVDIWDLPSNQKITTLEGHTRIIASVSFHPDGTRIATASQDLTVRVWDCIRGRNLMTFESTGVDLDPIVRFGPNGNRLAAYAFDGGSIRMWHSKTTPAR